MINIKSLTITQSGELKKLSIMWDELDENGDLKSTNNRYSKAIVDDKDTLDSINSLINFAKNEVEENSK